MANIPLLPFPVFAPGPRLIDGTDLNKLVNVAYSVSPAITAHAGGTKAAAVQIVSAINNVSTCATNADSVILPPGVAGMRIFIKNSGAASLQVFGYGTDTINGVATGTGVAQATTVGAEYFCTTSAPTGAWQRLLSA